jgi:hypothetical protein
VEVEVFKTRVFFFKTSHLSIFTIIFFGDDSRRETWRNFREDIEEYWVQVSDPDSLQVQVILVGS